MKKIPKVILSVVVCILLLLPLLAVAERMLMARLGSAASYNEMVKARDLAIKDTSVAKGVTSYAFLSKVGGIAFDKDAKPAENLRVDSFALRYDPSRPDGQRLVAQFNGIDYTVPILDWKLLPIIEFVESPYIACFSLFGSTGDEEEDKRVKEEYGVKYIPSYHAAFKDNLLGLRLMQMDSFFDSDLFGVAATDETSGIPILGPGESGVMDSTAYSAYRKILSTYEYDAYVISDLKSDIVFIPDETSHTLALSGELYVHYWRSPTIEEWNEKYMETINRISKKYDVIFDVSKNTEGWILAQSVKGQKQSISDAKKALEAARDMLRVVACDELNAVMANNMDKIRTINPDAYDATRDVMRHAALFMYSKHRGSAGKTNWKALVASIRKSGSQAFPVLTPTAVYQTR